MFVGLSAWNNTVPTRRNFMKFEYFSKIVKKFHVSFKSDRITGILLKT